MADLVSLWHIIAFKGPRGFMFGVYTVKTKCEMMWFSCKFSATIEPMEIPQFNIIITSIWCGVIVNLTITIKSHQIDGMMMLDDRISIGYIVAVNLHENHIISHFSFYSVYVCISRNLLISMNDHYVFYKKVNLKDILLGIVVCLRQLVSSSWNVPLFLLTPCSDWCMVLM